MFASGPRGWTPLLAAALAALTALGCRSRENQTTVTDSMARMDSAAPATAPTATTFTDPQITEIVIAANSTDSAGGAFIKAKTHSDAVKDFGQMMIRDHGALNKALQELVTKQLITPEENATSRQVFQANDSVTAAWSGLSGADLDRAYVDREVQVHQTVLDQLDQTLIPSAVNPDLKTFLQNARATVASHLERAKKLQTTLSTTKP